MTDVREDILKRILAIAKTVLPPSRRMDFVLNDDDLPYFVLMDGDESYPGDDEFKHPPEAAQLMLMQPKLLLFLEQADRVGEGLSFYRAKIIKAVVTDETLKNLTGHISGRRPIGARYIGCEVGVQLSEAEFADAAFSFALLYVLKPTDL